MSVSDSSSDVHRLVTAAQTTLTELEPLHDYRAMFVRVAFAGVQAGCAIALAVDHLAGAVLTLVIPDAEEPL